MVHVSAEQKRRGNIKVANVTKLQVPGTCLRNSNQFEFVLLEASL